jgi:hypothetical protein
MGFRHWFEVTITQANLGNLLLAVRLAGYVCDGISDHIADNGMIGIDLNLETLTVQQRAQLASIIANHDPIDREAERRADALDGIIDRYAAFNGKTFLEVVEMIDNWANALNARIEAATTVVDIKHEIQAGFSDIAEYLGPALAWLYINKR